ncbi:aldolase [Vallitalea longa]|uniref:Aldolase n=1 Tax=Vallitalea longa TaxID=2936439 RepID=A0A9W5YC50_9FIRM|nr:class II aldolase/adducin family protein [Vallitalea longa]GKX29816.1 aldolase [Vallitalea longa]
MDFKKLIIESGKKLINSGFTIETWGNISVKDEETGLVYLTPSGMDYCDCTTDDVVVCNLDGEIVEGTRKPTIETELHLSVYRNRPEVKAVVHTHPIYSTVFSCMGEDIPLLIDEAAQALGAPVKTANYALPGTKELAEECIKALGKEANACLLQSHGAVCVGESMEAAFKVANVLEVTAQIYQLIRSVGKDFVPLSEENIQAMKEFAKYKYGQGK